MQKYSKSIEKEKHFSKKPDDLAHLSPRTKGRASINHQPLPPLELTSMLKKVKNKMGEIKKAEVKAERRILKVNPRTRAASTSWMREVDHETASVKEENKKQLHFLTETEIQGQKEKKQETQREKQERNLVEISEKLDEIQNKEISRVLEIYSEKNNDPATVEQLEKVLRLISNESRALYEVHKFVKERGFRANFSQF